MLQLQGERLKPKRMNTSESYLGNLTLQCPLANHRAQQDVQLANCFLCGRPVTHSPIKTTFGDLNGTFNDGSFFCKAFQWAGSRSSFGCHVRFPICKRNPEVNKHLSIFRFNSITSIVQNSTTKACFLNVESKFLTFKNAY